MKKFLLLLIITFSLASNSNSQQPPATPEIKIVEILSVKSVNSEEAINTIEYNSLIAVTLKDTNYFNTIINTLGFENKQIYLAFNGYKFPNYFLKEYNERDNVLYFDFYHQEKNFNLKEFFGSSFANPIDVKFDIVYNGKIISQAGKAIKIQFYEHYRLILACITLLVFWAIVIYVSTKTNLLKQRVKVYDREKKIILAEADFEQYSLGRFFALMWTGVIASIYLFFYILASQIPELLGSTLVLLGITLGTTLVGETKTPTKPQVKSNTNNTFFQQILDDKNGPSIDRFQALVFNIIFLVIFISYAVAVWEFYQFNEYQLGLIGIANGAFLGFKLMK
ncbi:MAG: hypothetical protein SGI89_13540 [bacterium]|nr:hypothetical protein [bacterium]